MDLDNLFKSRIVTAEEVVKHIKSGDRVFLSGNCSVPQTLLASLVDYASALKDIEIIQALTIGSADYVAPEMEGHLRVKYNIC